MWQIYCITQKDICQSFCVILSAGRSLMRHPERSVERLLWNSVVKQHPTRSRIFVLRASKTKTRALRVSGVSQGIPIAFVRKVIFLMLVQESNTEQKSYCISLGDPIVAVTPRFCFAHFATQNFDYGLRPALRMTRSRKMMNKLVGTGVPDCPGLQIVGG